MKQIVESILDPPLNTIAGNFTIDGDNKLEYKSTTIQVDDSGGPVAVTFGENAPKGHWGYLEKHLGNSNEVSFVAGGAATIHVIGAQTLSQQWDQAKYENKGGNVWVIRTSQVG